MNESNVVFKIRRKSDGKFLNRANYLLFTADGKTYTKRGYAKAALTTMLTYVKRNAERPFWMRYDDPMKPTKEKEKAAAIEAATEKFNQEYEVVEFSVVPVASYDPEGFRNL